MHLRCEYCGTFIGENHSCDIIREKQSEAKRLNWEDKDYKELMSKAHKGQHSSPATEFKKGKKSLSYWKGKKRDVKTKQKISLNRKGKCKGSEHPNWQGGKSFEIYPREFWEIRNFIRERDNFTCQICNNFGLEVHHKDCNKNNNNQDNLTILCKSCHMKLHWEIKNG